MIIELLTLCRSGIGQCTHCRGGAESVLTLSSTVIGVGLHRLGASPSPSSTRLRLVELGLGLGGLEWSQRWFTSCNFSQVHLGQVELD